MDHIEVIHEETTNPAGRIASGSSTLSTANKFSKTPAIVSERTPLRSGSTSAFPIQYQTMSIGVSDLKQQVNPNIYLSGKAAVTEISALEWHALSIEEVCRRLGTNRLRGLSPTQIFRKRLEVGRNVHSPSSSHRLRKLSGYIFGGFGGALIVSGILCCVAWRPLGEPHPEASYLALGIVLFIVAGLQVFFNAWQDWSSNRVIASLYHLLLPQVAVRRSGATTSVHYSELVPGDIVQISTGSHVPADLRLSQVSADLKFNKAVLTGDSKPIKASVDKTSLNFLETKNIALQGTVCTSGDAQGIVILTGDSTIFGRIAKLTSKRQPGRTILQQDIRRLVLVCVGTAVVISIIVVIVWASWLRRDHPEFLSTSGLIVAIVSVSVALIPEGLPITVTVSLTLAAMKLKRRKVLCKSLSTLETLGSINVLCADKTGTITENRMAVKNAAIMTDTMVPAQAHNAILTGDATSLAWKQLWHVAALSCTVNLDSEGGSTIALDRTIGDATDIAALRFADALLPIQTLTGKWTPSLDIPFNSKNKFMLRMFETTSLVVRDAVLEMELSGSSGRHHVAFLKGAPDVLLPLCTSVLDSSGRLLDMSQEIRDKLKQLQISWARTGQRVLFLARRVVSDTEVNEFINFMEKSETMHLDNLVAVGMIGIVDRPRQGIGAVVRTCRAGGIRVVMVTGDYGMTAEAIAREVGIITAPPGPLHSIQHLDRSPTEDGLGRPLVLGEKMAAPLSSIIIGGNQLPFLNDFQWSRLCLYQEIIFARTSPEQKLRIVREFQSHGNLVGMTGDGINDAPSLKAADIGIAMSTGSDIAIEAAHVVLLDSFPAIIAAMEYGRLVFENLKKSIVYQFPAGVFSELMAVLLNIFLGLPLILSRFLMIVISTLIDCAPAIAVAFEKPENDLLALPPRNLKLDRITNPKLLIHGFVYVGILECLPSIAMAFWYLQREGIPFSVLFLSFGSYPPPYDPAYVSQKIKTASSIYFVNLVIIQLFNLFAVRTRRRSLLQQDPIIKRRSRNLWLFAAVVFVMGNVFFFCYIPWFQMILGTSRVPYEYFLYPIGFGVALLLSEEMVFFLLTKHY